MTNCYYWISRESARTHRLQLANPCTEVSFRWMRSHDGLVSLAERKMRARAIHDAPGYVSAVCLKTGYILEYTERHEAYGVRPSTSDAVFLGEFNDDHIAIVRYQDGLPARYTIGYGGLYELELTATQAHFLGISCHAANLPMPIIKWYDNDAWIEKTEIATSA